MSKTVFDVLSEKIDQVILGRRYIIAEVGKVKVSLEDFAEAIENAQFKTVATAISDMKAFMQRAVGSLGDLKSSVTNLSNTVSSLKSSVENTFNVVQNLKSAPAPAAPAPAPAPTAPAPAGGGDEFGTILQKAKAQVPAKDIGVMLDTLRANLSKVNPLNPILFELSMEAGRLKSLGQKTLSDADVAALETKVSNWRAKSK